MGRGALDGNRTWTLSSPASSPPPLESPEVDPHAKTDGFQSGSPRSRTEDGGGNDRGDPILWNLVCFRQSWRQWQQLIIIWSRKSDLLKKNWANVTTQDVEMKEQQRRGDELWRTWDEMGFVRVYTKPQGQQPDSDALYLGREIVHDFLVFDMGGTNAVMELDLVDWLEFWKYGTASHFIGIAPFEEAPAATSYQC